MDCKVTFIMPAYNPGNLIRKSIESLQAQSVREWRLIIIDDGSTDSTPLIAKEYAESDSRISLLTNRKGSGSAFQPRKRGISAAETEFVSPLDSDDMIESDYLEKLLSLQEKLGTDITYPAMYRLGNEDHTLLTPTDSNLLNKAFQGKDTVKYTLDGWRINCNGGIIRKSLYMEAFSRFGSNSTLTFADELLSRHLLYLAPKVAFSDAGYLYRENMDSITHIPSHKMFHLLENHIALIEFTRKMYGESSIEHLLAQKENFHGIFDAELLLKKYHFSPDTVAYARRMMNECKRRCNRDLLRGNVSNIYFHMLFSSPVPLDISYGALLFFKKLAKKKGFSNFRKYDS